MLPKYCIRKCSSHKNNPRRPTYSSLSRYQRSLRYRIDDIQHSPSISVSDEQQRPMHVGLANANSCELNGLALRKEQQVQSVSSAATKETGCQEYTRSVSRDSNCSQLTIMTSTSRQGLKEGNNNVDECLLRTHRSPKTVTLGSLHLPLLL